MSPATVLVAAALLVAGLAGQAGAGEKSSRELAIEIDKAIQAAPETYPRELVEKCTAAAIRELKACAPDPAVVAKLAALPDNTWLEMNEPESKGTPANHHSFPRGRGEGSACYDATTKGMVCFGGCGAPDYSSDLWVYKTGANRWFEVWPNFPKHHVWAKLKPPPADRPQPGCTLGLAYAAETGCVYRFTCANTGNDSPNVWETKVLDGKWRIAGRDNETAGGVRIVEDAVLGGLLAVSPGGGTKLFSFKSGKWEKLPGEGPKVTACYALAYLPKHKCALLVSCTPGEERKTYDPATSIPPETWLFHSETRSWEQVKVEKGRGPEWYYRAGIAYDALNDVVAMGGWKTNDPANGPDISPDLWIFDPAKKSWSFTKPAAGPSGRLEYFVYDPEYNVFVTAANGHGTWAYRYKRVGTAKGN